MYKFQEIKIASQQICFSKCFCCCYGK